MPSLSNRTAVACAALVAGSVVLHGYWSRATPNGQTKDTLSFGGTLSQNGKPLTGQQTITFAFKKNGATVCSPQSTVTPDSVTGAFNAQIDVSGCPGATLFDGADVVVDLTVGGNVIASNQPINPVPYAKYADRVGVPDCPVGYARDAAQMGYVVCKKGADEVVKVGTGPSAFWIDRYEASLWQNPDGTGTQYGVNFNDAHAAGFTENGQFTTPMYGVSKTGVAPSVWLDWFQAVQACRLSGKRLPTDEEWIVASRGTIDPGVSTGGAGSCVTTGNVRGTGMGTACASVWGAQDMIGNVWEYTTAWAAGVGNVSQSATPWPAAFNGDGTNNIASSAIVNTGTPVVGLPAVALRGGNVESGAAAGLFAYAVRSGPTDRWWGFGFRCVIPN